MLRIHCIAFWLLAVTVAQAQTWKPLGPPGGDVRVLAVDPSRPERIFLGTADGHIFGSQDSGAHWALLGRASTRLDAVITAIVVDQRDGNDLYAASWTRNAAAGGGVFRSRDGGRTWVPAGLAGQAVRALASAPSDPDFLVAGTLDGVYRTRDASQSWERISPERHQELRNLDSLAIDPLDPQTIYAGTFHLPWKTSDGGRTWRPIHNGMIDDSDVMSLLIDQSDPRRVYASACSGIYRTDDGAGEWRKIQGIPYTARRTYQIAQDPKQPSRVYAATSEGLWKTSDGGMTWRMATPQSWMVNAVVVAGGESGRVLIGTEELGVLASDDQGVHFQDANSGFDHRQIMALGQDARQPGRVLAVLAHAPEPVLVTSDDGKTWSPLGPGLTGDSPVRVYSAPDSSWWVSLARGGLMRYDAEGKEWRRAGTIVSDAAIPHSRGRSSNGPRPLQEVVADMAFSSKEWYAATGTGLLVSTDRGATWTRRPVGMLASLPLESLRVFSNGRRIRVVSFPGLVFSDDGGSTWSWHDLPLASGGAVALDSDPNDENTLVGVGRNGLYISRDAGDTWQQAGSGLPFTPVQDIAVTGGAYVAAMRTGGLYISTDSGRTWFRLAGVPANDLYVAVAPAHDPGKVLAASATDGLYLIDWADTTAVNSGSPRPLGKQLIPELSQKGN